jgi:hypothetical protein
MYEYTYIHSDVSKCVDLNLVDDTNRPWQQKWLHKSNPPFTQTCSYIHQI